MDLTEKEKKIINKTNSYSADTHKRTLIGAYAGAIGCLCGLSPVFILSLYPKVGIWISSGILGMLVGFLGIYVGFMHMNQNYSSLINKLHTRIQELEGKEGS